MVTLMSLMTTMDIPNNRRDVSRADNVEWLRLNLRGRNPDHKHIDIVMDYIHELSMENFKCTRKETD